jgi:hypothetical protein
MSATNLQLYTAAYVYVNGGLLAEEAHVTVDRATNSQPNISVAKGYSGESPGAPQTEISVESNVPAASFEFNPGPFMGQLQQVEFTIFAAAMTMTFKGFIISDNFTHAANTASKLSFKARGVFSDWQ